MENENQILLLLGELRGKMDAVLNEVAHQGKRADGLEERIRVLEGAKARLLGGASALSAAVAVLIHFLTK